MFLYVCVNIQKVFFSFVESLLCVFSSGERLDDDDDDGNGNGIDDEVPLWNMCIMFGERSMLYDIFCVGFGKGSMVQWTPVFTKLLSIIIIIIIVCFAGTHIHFNSIQWLAAGFTSSLSLIYFFFRHLFLITIYQRVPTTLSIRVIHDLMHFHWTNNNNRRQFNQNVLLLNGNIQKQQCTHRQLWPTYYGKWKRMKIETKIYTWIAFHVP